MKHVTFQAITLNIIESNEHTFLMSSCDVAAGYDVTESIIRSHRQRHSDELIEGKHFIMTRTANNAAKTMWTLEGVHMLGFFIKSERAKEFRKWTAKLLTEIRTGNATISHGDNELKQIILQQNEQIAQLTLELEEMQKMIGHENDNEIPVMASWMLFDLIGNISKYIEEGEHIEILQRKRRNSMEQFMRSFVKLMKNDGLMEQSMRKSENINHQTINSQR